MKHKPDKKLARFYLWVGLGYLLLGVTSSLGSYPGRLAALVINNFWAILFLIPVNYILFEYSLPFILKKRNSLFYNILSGIFILWIHLMIYSFGSYAWRL